MSQIVKNIVLPMLVVVTGFASIAVLTPLLERQKIRLPDTFADSDLSMNGSRLKGYALGMEGLLADWYWVRSLQYIGDKMVNSTEERIDLEDLRSLKPRLLYPLLDNATDLDPHFIGAYEYGAIVLPAIDKEKGIALAKKGIANNPKEWRLYQHLGYIYWKLGQYELAAETYQNASEIPGASPFMKFMAGAMRTSAGSRETARSIYTQMAQESADDAIRETAERRLMALDWLDERETIDPLLAAFKEKHGRCANSFGEITAQLMQARLPNGREFRVDSANRLVDPSNAPYKLDRDKCVVALDHDKTKLPIDE